MKHAPQLICILALTFHWMDHTSPVTHSPVPSSSFPSVTHTRDADAAGTGERSWRVKLQCEGCSSLALGRKREMKIAEYACCRSLEGAHCCFQKHWGVARVQGSATMFLSQEKGMSLMYTADARQQVRKSQVPGEQKLDLKDWRRFLKKGNQTEKKSSFVKTLNIPTLTSQM